MLHPSPSTSTAHSNGPAVLTRGGTVVSLGDASLQRSKSTISVSGKGSSDRQPRALPNPPISVYRNNPPERQHRTRSRTTRAARGGFEVDPEPSNHVVQVRSPILTSPSPYPTAPTLAARLAIHSRPAPHTPAYPEGQGSGHPPNTPIPGQSQNSSGASASRASRTQPVTPAEDVYEYNEDEDELESDDDNHVHRRIVCPF